MLNCWQVMKCGRQPYGEHALELGVCPASIDVTVDQFNDGINGGRICWAIAGTLCGGEIQGSFVEKAGDCSNCTFYKQVKAEQQREFVCLPLL